MDEKNINVSNKILYYVVSPCLLIYFILIDSGIIKCSLVILGIFLSLIAIGVFNLLRFKKINADYKFEVNKVYAKAMFILVLLEFSYSLSK